MSSIFTQKITFGRMIKYALPSIIMQVFLSLYSIVDEVFVSRLVGSEALAAINISYPAISMMVPPINHVCDRWISYRRQTLRRKNKKQDVSLPSW